MNKTFIFSLLMLCQLICCFALAIIAPFFPPFAKDHGISEEIVGLIFCSNPIGAIIASLILGKVLDEKNRFKFMVAALFLQGIGLFLFSVTNWQDGATAITTTAIGARLINGFATASFLTPLYAYIPVLYPESIEQKISIAEIFAALGFLIGPVAGSALYGLGGYLLPFLFFGTLSLVLVPIIGIQFKKLVQLDKINPSDHHFHPPGSLLKSSVLAGKLDEDIDKIPLSYTKVIMNYPIGMTAFASIAVNSIWNFYMPICANFFQEAYDSGPTEVGYYMAILPGTYVVSSAFMGYYKDQKILKMFIGAVVAGVAAFFVGPDQYFTTLNHNIYVTLAAFGVMGIAAAPLVIFTVPVLNDFLYVTYPKQPTQCANISSALFNSGNFLSELFSPFLAGVFSAKYGFERSMSIIGFWLLFFALLYLPVLIYFKLPTTIPKQEESKPLVTEE